MFPTRDSSSREWFIESAIVFCERLAKEVMRMRMTLLLPRVMPSFFLMPSGGLNTQQEEERSSSLGGGRIDLNTGFSNVCFSPVLVRVPHALSNANHTKNTYTIMTGTSQSRKRVVTPPGHMAIQAPAPDPGSKISRVCG